MDDTASANATTPATDTPIPTPSRRGGGRWWTALLVLFAVALLISLGGSGVLAARGLASLTRAHPANETVISAGAPGAKQTLSQVTLSTAAQTSTQAMCPCAPVHQSVAVPPPVTRLVVVSLSQQWLWAYQNGQVILSTPVTTGMPGLETPTGTFHIMMKESNIWFYSPWPVGSPYYYAPEHIDYAMLFLQGGFYLHNAPWRETFGPGTNVPHTEPDGTTATGSHGCVNMPTAAAAQLYYWIRIGTTVVIRN